MVSLNKARMKDFVRLIRIEKHGVVLSTQKMQPLMDAIRAETDLYGKGKFRIKLILGQPGSGKSSSVTKKFIQWLHGPRLGRWIMAYPNTEVRDRVKASIESEHPGLKDFGCFMPTRELAFKSSSHVDVLNIDEAGRWLPGEIETLILRLKPDLTLINGDPLQGRHPRHGINGTSVGLNPNFLDVLLPLSDVYFDFSRRLSSNWSPYLGFPCYGPESALPTHLKYLKPGSEVLVPDEMSKNSLANLGYTTMTYGSSQGWDAQTRYVLLINRDSFKCCDNTVYSAITRSGKGFDIFISEQIRPVSGQPSKSSARPGSIMEALYSLDLSKLRSALIKHRASNLPPSLRDCLTDKEILIGAHRTVPFPARPLLVEIPERHSTSLEVPHFLSKLDLLRSRCPEYWMIDTPEDVTFPLLDPELKAPAPTDSADMDIRAPSVIAKSLKTPADLDDLATFYFGEPRSKELREYDFHGTMTNQVDDSSRAKAMYLKHSSKDPTLMRWAIEKRVRFRRRDPALELMLAKTGSSALIATFERLVGPGLIPLDEEMYRSRQKRSMENLLEKDVALNMNKAFKTYPDVPENLTFLAIKQQIIKKIGCIDRSAKAGQILTEHAHRVALDLAPVFMYILYKTQELVKDQNIYLHPGHSDSDLAKFIAEHWDFSRLSLEDDAEAWDSNFDAPFIGLEFYLLDKFSIPEDLKLRFFKYKTAMECIMGPIAFMMFSGGPDTLPMNTVGNMVVQNLKYIIKRNSAQLYGGDDVAINDDPCLSPFWHLHSGLIHQIFKTIRTYHPCAVGWRIYPRVHKDPATVLARLLYSEACGKGAKTIRDLLADYETLLHSETICELSDHEVDMIMAGGRIANQLRIKYHVGLSGFTTGKTGSKRRYNLENNSMLTDSL
jgi:hypothetical protein